MREKVRGVRKGASRGHKDSKYAMWQNVDTKPT